MTDELVSALMGFAAVGITAGLAYLLSARFTNTGAKLKRFYPEAGIASVMIPLVSAHRTKDSTVYIVGSDGEYACGNPQWPNGLESWLAEGNRVSYLLIDPTEAAIKIFRRIQDQYPDHFRFTAANSSSVRDKPRVSELIHKYETFHFALFDNPPQMWIEGSHPRKSPVAYNCEYLPPKEAATDPRFYRFKDNFLLVQHGVSKA